MEPERALMRIRRHKANPDSYMIFDEYTDMERQPYVQDDRCTSMEQAVIDVAKNFLAPGEEGVIFMNISVIRSRRV